MATIRVNFGISGLSDVGYRFYSGNTPLGTRATTGISDDGDGWYSALATWAGDQVRWDSATVGGAPARQYRTDQSDAIVSSSETDIANLALAHLGESPIASLAEDTSAARACARHYATVRDQVFRSHRWNFAQARAALTSWVAIGSVANNGGLVRVTSTAHGLENGMRVAVDGTGVDGSYLIEQVTVDTFTLTTSVWSASVSAGRYRKMPQFGWSYEYALPDDCMRVLEVNDSEAGDWISDEYVIEGRAILTDAETMNLVYVKRVTDPAEFDALFREALALKLAIALTESIRGTTSKTAELTTMYEQRTAPLARRVDANEGRRRKGILPMNSMAIRARLQGI